MFENTTDNSTVEKLYSWLKQKKNFYPPVKCWQTVWLKISWEMAPKRLNYFLFFWLTSFPKFSESYGRFKILDSKNPYGNVFLYLAGSVWQDWSRESWSQRAGLNIQSQECTCWIEALITKLSLSGWRLEANSFPCPSGFLLQRHYIAP